MSVWELDTLVRLDQLYHRILNENDIKQDISNIDSLGLNVSEQQNKFPFEFKVYYQPEEKIEKVSEDHELIRFLIDNNMVKFRCAVKGTVLHRSYVVLKNQSYLNMYSLDQMLLHSFPNLEERLKEVPALVVEQNIKSNKKYLPLHILGVKTDRKKGIALNLEWLLRDYLDKKCNNYKYNDLYYINYILSLNSQKFCDLVRFIQEMYGEMISKGHMHLWLMAIDYFSNRSKYKLYLKIDGCNFYISELIKRYFGNQQGILLANTIDKFLNLHPELKVYGFAVCVDSNNNKSINIYFISLEE